MSQACTSALGDAEFYEHTKTESWNTAIIVCTFYLSTAPPLTSTQNSILKQLISESSPNGGQPAFKYAVNSTIIQHLVPTSALNKPKPAASSSTEVKSEVKNQATDTENKPHVGRRGMHSATGAYWNEKTDGMWSYKYDGGENKGLDVVISIIWIAV